MSRARRVQNNPYKTSRVGDKDDELLVPRHFTSTSWTPFFLKKHFSRIFLRLRCPFQNKFHRDTYFWRIFMSSGVGQRFSEFLFDNSNFGQVCVSILCHFHCAFLLFLLSVKFSDSKWTLFSYQRTIVLLLSVSATSWSVHLHCPPTEFSFYLVLFLYQSKFPDITFEIS